MVDPPRKPSGKFSPMLAAVASLAGAGMHYEDNRRVLVRISAAPKEPRRELTDEERAQLKLDRKERRAARMRLRKRRGFR